MIAVANRTVAALFFVIASAFIYMTFVPPAPLQSSAFWLPGMLALMFGIATFIDGQRRPNTWWNIEIPTVFCIVLVVLAAVCWFDPDGTQQTARLYFQP